jgi:Mn2+/Fe2+ NRAMP family transporter
MAAAGSLLTGIQTVWFLVSITIGLLVLLAYASYARIASIFKWLTLTLFAYVGAAILARPHWVDVFRGTVLPPVTITPDYLLTIVAILGTTISPYLFFWQAATEVEEHAAQRAAAKGRGARSAGRPLRVVRDDVLTGMLLSNVIMYFIILTAGATLHRVGQTEVVTAQQAASALQPLAGKAASLLFALGLIGTGLLGVPVLAGSAAYAIAEAASWRRGMDQTPSTAGKFYAVIAVGLLIGMAIDLVGINPIRLLFWSAVLNGLLAPPLIVIILVVANDRRVMGQHRNGPLLNAAGIAAAVLMGVAAIALIL